MIRRSIGLAALAAGLAGHAAAQEQSSAPAPATQSFEPAFFARYSPNNALDIVQQVPGFTLAEGDAVRGFGGAAGNILINGERPSTKSSLSGLLSRIPASAVIRVELITGASATLDMRGQTKVVNVIVREDALAQPITFDTTVRQTHDGRLSGMVQLSKQLDLFGGQLNLSGLFSTLAGNGPGGGSFVDGQRHRYNGAGASTEFAEGYTEQQPAVRQLNFEYQRDFDWFKLHTNGALGATDVDGDRFWRSYTPDHNGALAGYETNVIRNSQWAWSFGGDIERSFGDVDLKLITYNRREFNDNSTRFTTFGSTGALALATTSAPESEGGESIVRGQLNWRFNEHHSIEFAAEAAYNYVDNLTGFIRTTPAGTTSFFVDGSDTKVEEFRNEFQVSDVWTVNANLTIEPGFKFETSRIEQAVNYPDDTDNDPLTTRPDRLLEREFEYPKPSITATWRIRPGQQLRVSYEREVAQLSFADFVSAADLVANQTTTGNVDLVPERTWAFNAEFEQRFWRGGVLTLLASYDQVEDVQDFVKIGAGDGPGNIGDGTRWSLGFRATVPLDNLGIPGGRIDASLNGGGSEVTDPITGRTREFSDEFKENWSISYRQDIPSLKISYGFRWSDGGPATAYRFNESSRRSRDDADVSIFVETTAFFGLRIRAGIDDLLPADFARTRLIYTGDRELTPLRLVEQTHSTNGVQPFIRISGKF
jgi:hypothetical protein